MQRPQSFADTEPRLLALRTSLVLKAEPHNLGFTLYYKLEKKVEVFKYGQLPSKSGMVHGE
jgi:hypothetical protein